jgi:hypothetical protein
MTLIGPVSFPLRPVPYRYPLNPDRLLKNGVNCRLGCSLRRVGRNLYVNARAGLYAPQL